MLSRRREGYLEFFLYGHPLASMHATHDNIIPVHSSCVFTCMENSKVYIYIIYISRLSVNCWD